MSLHFNFYLANSVRLVDDSSHSEGRLEVYYSGRWGTVCNHGWNDNYAALVCAQLGFGPSGRLADFGAGTGSILLENVMCSINDTVLAGCGHLGVGLTVHCNHNSDVGIKCNVKSTISMYLFGMHIHDVHGHAAAKSKCIQYIFQILMCYVIVFYLVLVHCVVYLPLVFLMFSFNIYLHSNHGYTQFSLLIFINQIKYSTLIFS